jgi:cell division protein FtsL
MFLRRKTYPHFSQNEGSSRSTSKALRGPLEALFSVPALGIFFLMICLLLSAMAVIVSKHLDRTLHIRLQQLQKNRDDLHIEWSRLLLEQSTLGSDPRVEKIAREQLGMTVPAPNQVQVMRP